MDEQIIRELENAATIILAAPNLVTNEQRKLAEAIFLNFRKTKTPYNICKVLLETSANDYVKFEAAEALKCALIREWIYLNENDTLALRDYLMHYVCTHDLRPFVKDRLLQVIAIMVKRASVDDFGLERQSILQDVENLIINSDTGKQILGCKIILALMQEYAITTKSTDVGLPLEVHRKAKLQFEATDLRRIFRFCLTLLAEVGANDAPHAPNVAALLHDVLRICEAVLTWSVGRRPERAEHDARLTLGAAWSEIACAAELLPLMFRIYWRVRDLDEHGALALTCLVQLASLNGPVFRDDAALAYLAVYMENFLKLLTCATIRSKESLGVANIVLNVRLSFDKEIMRLPKCLQASCFDEITRLTCFFIEASTMEESTPNGNYAAAFETMLEAWTLMIYEYKDTSDVLVQSATSIFDKYLEYHLAPPDGRRRRDADADAEVAADEDSDRVKYIDHLQAIGLFGRTAPDHALPMLTRLLETRVGALGARLRAMLRAAMSPDDAVALDDLFEDLHWLVLVAGHTLCMESDGETPLIPAEIMRHSIERYARGDADLEATLRTMDAGGGDGDGVERCDPAVRLFGDVLRLCTLEKHAHEHSLGAFMSPELGCTLMWFLKRWCLSYLLPVETYYDEFSPTLIGSMGRDTEGATFVANYFLDKIQSNIFFCKDEAILLRDTVDVFTEFVNVKEKSEYLVKTEGLWNLIELQSTIPPGVLPHHVRKELYKGFVLAGASLARASDREAFYRRILKPVEQRLKEILCQEDLNRVYHEERVRVELVDVVEKLIGISQGAKKPTVPIVFDFLAPILSELPVLLGMYHNYQTIVQLILDLFGQCAKHMLCHLDGVASRRLYESTYAAVQTYARHNENRLAADAAADEEESLEDLGLLLSLLSHVLCKDWLDLTARDERALKASDVALYGLQYLMPLITADLLRHPKLCLQYYRFLVLMGDMYPDSVVAMHDDVLARVMASIELGVSKLHADVVHVCLDFLETMATHVYHHQLADTRLYQLLRPFLGLLLELTLTQRINSDHVPAVSTCVFSLHCIYPEQYRLLVQSLVGGQSDARVAERLLAEFNQLHWQQAVKCDPMHKTQFRQQFEKFVANVHGFMLIK